MYTLHLHSLRNERLDNLGLRKIDSLSSFDENVETI